MGWIQIFLFPLIIGLVLGAIIYSNKQDIIGLVIGIFIAVIGLIVGVILATRIWRKKGTVTFLSRIRATPELDGNEENKNDKVMPS